MIEFEIPSDFEHRPLVDRLKIYADQISSKRLGGRRLQETLREAAIELQLTAAGPLRLPLGS
jgi:hypothetical protein